MADPAQNEKFIEVLQRLAPHSTLIRVWALKGGVSAEVTGLEIAHADGRMQKMVVRQHGEVDRRSNQQVADMEFRLLELLRVAGLPVPTPLYLDESGTIFNEPYIVLEYIEGATDFSPVDLPSYLHQFAAHLALIHQITSVEHDLSFLPQQRDRYAAMLDARPSALDESLREGAIRDALEKGWPLPPAGESVVLHGDFWPGNILWQAGRLVGIIDWEDAQVGDPMVDLGNSRLEILWAFGMEAMQEFTGEYQALTGRDCVYLPYWDLAAALRPAGKIGEWAGDAAREKEMRERHSRFVAQAVSGLSRMEDYMRI